MELFKNQNHNDCWKIPKIAHIKVMTISCLQYRRFIQRFIALSNPIVKQDRFFR